MQVVHRFQSGQLAVKLQRKMERVTQNRTAQLSEIPEQEDDVEDEVSLEGYPSQEYRNDIEDEVPSEEHPCTSQEKTDENMDAHLMKICEQYMEEGRK